MRPVRSTIMIRMAAHMMPVCRAAEMLPGSVALYDEWDMAVGLFLLTFRGFFFLGRKRGLLFGFLVAALDSRHECGSGPELGVHGDSESDRSMS